MASSFITIFSFHQRTLGIAELLLDQETSSRRTLPVCPTFRSARVPGVSMFDLMCLLLTLYLSWIRCGWLLWTDGDTWCLVKAGDLRWDLSQVHKNWIASGLMMQLKWSNCFIYTATSFQQEPATSVLSFQSQGLIIACFQLNHLYLKAHS